MAFESTFEANPTISVLYTFEDGNAFLVKREADNYSAQTGKKIIVVEKEENVKQKKDKK